MTSEEALFQLKADVPRGTMSLLETYVGLLARENGRQNLVSRSTMEVVWARHILDSVQLQAHVPNGQSWLDIGSGAGLPGIPLAILGATPMTLVEPRPLRVAFLASVIEKLGLGSVDLLATKVEAVRLAPRGVITARAVAPLSNLFRAAWHLADEGTCWALLKGRSVASELEDARRSWHGDFSIHPSITDPDAGIVIARGVRPKESIR